ncbi:MAG TPA: hypothetical protein EYQ80_05645 [Candidatus Poseidoniales archaeon]|nr:hypothetical protein [Candidatus Poseidoniales archaeon]
MTHAKNVYALMLALVIVLSGCLSGDTADADDESDIVDDLDVDSSQARTWYSSGGIFNSWNDDNSAASGKNNFMFWDDGQDEHYTSNLSDWNLTECEDQGGVARLLGSGGYDLIYCDVTFATIHTSAGESLLVYEWTNFGLSTTCGEGWEWADGSSYLNNGHEYWIAPGSALDCQHVLMTTLVYDDETSPEIWSVVYAIQDVTVV